MVTKELVIVHGNVGLKMHKHAASSWAGNSLL